MELVIPMVNPACVATNAKSESEIALGVVFHSSPGVPLLCATDGRNSAETYLSVNSHYMLVLLAFIQSDRQYSDCIHFQYGHPKRDYSMGIHHKPKCWQPLLVATMDLSIT